MRKIVLSLLWLLASVASPITGAAQMSEQTLTTADGYVLHYSVHGSGADTVVVPLGVVLQAPLGALEESHTVIFYDMRGRGRSQPVGDPADLGFDKDVEDLDAVREHFDLSRFGLIGLSYLGGVVARYAAAHPDVVSDLVMLNPIPPRAPFPGQPSPGVVQSLTDAEQLARFLSLQEEGRSDTPEACEAFWAAYAPLYVGSQSDPSEVMARTDLGCALRNEAPDRMLGTIEAVFRNLDAYDWTSAATDIKARTLVVHGADDVVAPVEGAREWSRAIPGSRLLELEGLGHFAILERPAFVRGHVQEFLGGR